MTYYIGDQQVDKEEYLRTLNAGDHRSEYTDGVWSLVYTGAATISALKNDLARTDYMAIKFFEGELSAEDFEPIRVQRRQWRARINEIETLLNSRTPTQ